MEWDLGHEDQVGRGRGEGVMEGNMGREYKLAQVKGHGCHNMRHWGNQENHTDEILKTILHQIEKI